MSLDPAEDPFLETVSREILGPVGAIARLIQQGRDIAAPAQRNLALTKALDAVQVLEAVLADLLDFAVEGPASIDDEPVPWNIGGVLGEIAGRFSTQIASSEQRMVIDVAADIPFNLLGHPDPVSRAVATMVGNAVNFAEPGEILVGAKLIERAETSVLLAVTIRDRRDRQAMRSDRVALGTVRRIGLALAARLVQPVGGTVLASEVTGEGATFTFTVRADLADSVTTRLNLQEGAASPAAGLPEIPGFDLAPALRRFDGDPAFYRRVLLEFARSEESTGARIAELCAAGDLPGARAAALRLKSFATSFGAIALADSAAAFVAQPESGPEVLISGLGDALAAIRRIKET